MSPKLQCHQKKLFAPPQSAFLRSVHAPLVLFDPRLPGFGVLASHLLHNLQKPQLEVGCITGRQGDRHSLHLCLKASWDTCSQLQSTDAQNVNALMRERMSRFFRQARDVYALERFVQNIFQEGYF